MKGPLWLSVAVWCGLASATAAQDAFAIRGATVHFGDGTYLEAGTVLVRGGKIAAVGKDLPMPPNLKVIDASGDHVYPGLIDLNSSLWIDDRSRSGSGAALTSNVTDALDPFDSVWRDQAIARGVTSVYVAPQNNGLFSGAGALLKLAGEPDDAVVSERVAIGLAYDSSGSSASQRIRQVKTLGDQLDGAKKYVEAWDEYAEKLEEYEKELEKLRKEKGGDEKPAAEEKKPAADAEKKEAGEDEAKPEGEGEAGAGGPGPGGGRRRRRGGGGSAADLSWSELEQVFAAQERRRGRPGGRPAPQQGGGNQGGDDKKDEDGPKKPKRPQFDPNKEVLREVLEGKVAVHARVWHAADIVNLLEIRSRFPFRLVLITDGQIDEVAQMVADAGIPVILTTASALSADEPKAVALHEADVHFAIATPGSSDAVTRNLSLTAAASGLDAVHALRAVTVDAAKIVGAHDRIGKIAPGMDADLVIATGGPFATGARIEQVFIDGVEQYAGN